MTYYRLAIVVALGSLLFLVLGIGALGIIGDGGRNDRMYVGVLAVAVIGAGVARLRPRGMALALLATALTQVLVAVIALVTGVHRDAGASVVDLVGLTAMYAGLFGVSAWLFWRSAEQRSAEKVGART